MTKNTVSYEDGLQQRLQDPEYAAGYLNATLNSGFDDNMEDFLIALRDVAKAHGIAKIAEMSDLGRESLYKTLSKSGNPKFITLTNILKNMGLSVSITAAKKKPRPKKRAS